jgi:hypothetical protein
MQVTEFDGCFPDAGLLAGFGVFSMYCGVARFPHLEELFPYCHYDIGSPECACFGVADGSYLVKVYLLKS